MELGRFDQVTLPPTFIKRKRDSGFEFCPFGRAWRGALRIAQRQAPVAGRRFVRTRRAFASQIGNGGVRCYSPCATRPV